MFLKAFEDAILDLDKAGLLNRVKSIEFRKSSKMEDHHLTSLQNLKGTNIKIDVTKNDPFTARPGAIGDRLLVAMYAWDGNSFPGEGKKLVKTRCQGEN